MNPPRPLTVFITGASSGIGLALAKAYAERGATLGLVARRVDPLMAFAAQGHGAPLAGQTAAQVAIWAADVRDAPALARAAAEFIARFGCPDIVIANAGISQGTVTGQGDLDAFRAVMDTNYFGMIASFEPFVGPMSSARHGTLVGIASVAGVRGLPGAGAYSASKAAALKYLESLRIELRPAGVAVVTIAPGYVRTHMTHGNPYPMPFLMDAGRFAEKAVRAIARQTVFAVFPWQMRIVGALLHVLPRWLYDRLLAHAPRKPRAPAN